MSFGQEHTKIDHVMHNENELLSLIQRASDAEIDELGKRLVALKKIRTFSIQEIIIACETLLENETNEHSRLIIIDILTKAAPEYALPFIVQLLQAREGFVRASACGLLQRTGSPRAVEPLIKVLMNDTYVNARIGAAYVLGELGDERALAALEHASQFDTGIDDEEESIKVVAKASIKKIKTNSKSH